MSIPVGLVNCVSVNYAPERAARIAAGFIAMTRDTAKVWVLVEAFDFRLADEVPPGIRTRQYGDLGSPASALAIAWTGDVQVTDIELVPQVTRGQNKPGRRQDIRDRPALHFTVDGEPMTAVHYPPARMPVLRARYQVWVARNTRGRTVIGDFNAWWRMIRRWFPRARFISTGTRRRHVLHMVGRLPREVTMLRRVPKDRIPGHPDHHGLVGLVGRR